MLFVYKNQKEMTSREAINKAASKSELLNEIKISQIN